MLLFNIYLVLDGALVARRKDAIIQGDSATSRRRVMQHAPELWRKTVAV